MGEGEPGAYPADLPFVSVVGVPELLRWRGYYPHGRFMHCQEFLACYSDYRDDRADPALRRRLEQHLSGCERCRRYDALLARGVMVLRSVDGPRPSRGFRERLDLRLAEEVEPRRVLSGGPLAGLVVAAALVALAVPATRDQPPRSPVVSTLPISAPTMARDTDELAVPAFGGWHTPTSSDEPILVPVIQAP